MQERITLDELMVIVCDSVELYKSEYEKIEDKFKELLRNKLK